MLKLPAHFKYKNKIFHNVHIEVKKGNKKIVK